VVDGSRLHVSARRRDSCRPKLHECRVRASQELYELVAMLYAREEIVTELVGLPVVVALSLPELLAQFAYSPVCEEEKIANTFVTR
jgi:hypothetical protein